MASKKGQAARAPPAPDPLHLSEQTIETLHDPAYWRACCPFLTCERDSAAEVVIAAAVAVRKIDSAEEVALAAAAAAKVAAAAAMAAAAAAIVAVAVASPDAAGDLGLEATSAVTAATAAASLAVVASVAAVAATPDAVPDVSIDPAVAIAAAAAAVAVSEAAAAAAAAATTSALQARLATFGFFKLPAATLGLDAAVVAALGRGALRLLELGHSPSALLAYDEVWALSAAVNARLAPLTGNAPTGDYYTFVVEPGRHEFAGPHRDKPAAGSGPPSFRAPDDAPGFVTAWLALTSATPESSCLSFVPACHDAGYQTPGDALLEALPGPASWGNIIAQPCAPGDLLCFSHRIVHWGSRAQPGAPPRVALSWALADGAFEAPAFDLTAHGPYPPLQLRVALRAGQALAYTAQAPLSRAQLALDTRLFHAGARFFADEWRDRIAAAAQMELFRQKNAGGAVAGWTARQRKAAV